jgi:hypothetical protein
MIDRYPDSTGCRLDSGNGTEGRALDLYGRLSSKIPQPSLATLWIRDDEGHDLKIELNFRDVQALRNGCNRMLAAAGIEKVVSVNVPS